MPDTIHLHYDVPGDDFTRAGEASGNIKKKLKQLGIAPDVIRKVAISVYEGEINMVIHANGGVIDVAITTKEIQTTINDTGPGIPDVSLAMKEGWSTAPENVRSLGFGAGMGLPNMKKYTDEMIVDSIPGTGTTITMKVFID